MIGPITRPMSIIAGRYTDDGRLVIVGRSVPLSPAQSISLAAVLEPAGQGHPWPDTVISSRFGNGRDRVRLTKVQPTVVAEVSADTARQARRVSPRSSLPAVPTRVASDGPPNALIHPEHRDTVGPAT